MCCTPEYPLSHTLSTGIDCPSPLVHKSITGYEQNVSRTGRETKKKNKILAVIAVSHFQTSLHIKIIKHSRVNKVFGLGVTLKT